MIKGLREQAKQEAKEIVKKYNQVYLAFLIEELEKYLEFEAKLS